MNHVLAYPIVSNAFTSNRNEILITESPDPKSHMIVGVKSLSSNAPDLTVRVLHKNLCTVLCNGGSVFNTYPDKAVRNSFHLREENITITCVNPAMKRQKEQSMRV